MQWVHEGVGYFSPTPPVRQVRQNKPHIAVGYGVWWASNVGCYNHRVKAISFVTRLNTFQNRPMVFK